MISAIQSFLACFLTCGSVCIHRSLSDSSTRIQDIHSTSKKARWISPLHTIRTSWEKSQDGLSTTFKLKFYTLKFHCKWFKDENIYRTFKKCKIFLFHKMFNHILRICTQNFRAKFQVFSKLEPVNVTHLRSMLQCVTTGILMDARNRETQGLQAAIL